MKIRLNEKYKPFSHEAGTPLLIPRSSWKATVCPAKIQLESLLSIGGKAGFNVIPHITGPLSKFTVMQDLERQWIRVFGQSQEGYFSYRLVASSHEVILFLERGPDKGISFTFEEETKVLKRKEELIIPTTLSAFPKGAREKMHFGCTKKQDWQLVKRRKSIEEILPIWFELGKHIPSHPILDVGTSRLLAKCKKEVHAKENDQIGKSLMDLFDAGFEGILSPRLFDESFLGHSLDEKEVPQEASPLMLLGEGARLIRSLLIQERDDGFAILPCLPKELHAGRFTHVELREGLIADLEWSKKLIRRLLLHPKKDQPLTLTFQSSVQSFRLRTGRRGRGKTVQVGTPLDLKADTLYILDRFQK